MDELGWKFWLWVIGVSLAIGIGGIVLFLLIGAVWYSWGFFGALIFFSAIALVSRTSSTGARRGRHGHA